MKNALIALGLIGILIAGGVIALRGSGTQAQANVLILPALSPYAVAGQAAFNTTCAACHGDNGIGSPQGPPLIHMIYEPGHHGDASFVRAVKQGVRAHHWPFGNMPAQPHVTDVELAAIIAFVREVQIANGIR